MNELAVSISQLIRSSRKSKRISQENLALQCGIDRSYLGRIERGEVNITIKKLYDIAEILEENPKKLLPLKE